MSGEVVSAILETIMESIEMVQSRISKIHQPDDLVSSSDGVTIMDAISMRLQVIVEDYNAVKK